MEEIGNLKIHQCLNIETGELMVVKCISLSENQAEALKEYENLRNEVQLLKSLEHPNILKYYQSELTQDQTCVNIIQEYVPSGSISNLIEKYEKIEEAIIRIYAKQILKALTCLHSHEIIHRYLNCASALVTETGSIKLSGFRFSKKAGDAENFCIINENPSWIAPEIIQQKEYSTSADIWSFGCLILEMITGKPPWFSKTSDLKEIKKLLEETEEIPNMPTCMLSLQSFIKLCLNRNPLARPTALQLLKHKFITGKTYSIEFNDEYQDINDVRPSFRGGLRESTDANIQAVIHEINSQNSEWDSFDEL